MEQHAKVFVRLVHGTWARGAAWLEPTSRIRSGLKSKLPESAVIESFCWTGRNTAQAREIAAQELARSLQQQVQDDPTAVHFVIGHSHGGNVALKAVEIANLFSKVHVICLSTPFFHVCRRNYGTELPSYAMQAGAAICFFAACMYLSSRLLGFWSLWNLLTLGVSILLLRSADGLMSRWRERADEIIGRFVIAVPATANLMIVRTVGDEAVAAIAAFQFVGWLTTTMIRKYVGIAYSVFEKSPVVEQWLDRVPRRIRLAALVFCIITIPLIIVLLVVNSIGHPVHPFSRFWGHSLFAMLCITIVLMGLSLVPTIASGVSLGAVGALAPFALVIMGCAILPMGMEAFIATLYYEVSVEAMPAGAWVINQIVPEKGDRLNHSAPYNDPNALSAIQDWMVKRVENSNTGQTCAIA